MLCRNLPTYIVHVEMHVYYSRHFTYLLPLVIEIFNLDWLYFIQSTFLLRAQKIFQLDSFQKCTYTGPVYIQNHYSFMQCHAVYLWQFIIFKILFLQKYLQFFVLFNIMFRSYKTKHFTCYKKNYFKGGLLSQNDCTVNSVCTFVFRRWHTFCLPRPPGHSLKPSLSEGQLSEMKSNMKSTK